MPVKNLSVSRRQIHIAEKEENTQGCYMQPQSGGHASIWLRLITGSACIWIPGWVGLQLLQSLLQFNLHLHQLIIFLQYRQRTEIRTLMWPYSALFTSSPELHLSLAPECEFFHMCTLKGNAEACSSGLVSEGRVIPLSRLSNQQTSPSLFKAKSYPLATSHNLKISCHSFSMFVCWQSLQKPVFILKYS